MNVQQNKTGFEIDDLIGIVQRENNAKRGYLIVNRFQAKHFPVSPIKALELFDRLGKEVYKNIKGETVTFIGFAETATAIGASVAVNCPKESFYIHTTREPINKKFAVVDFKEEHSHATQQALFCTDIKTMLIDSDNIVFIEDEITTGKTILNFVSELRKEGINGSFSVASILNSMNHENMNIFKNEGIDVYFLAHIENDFDKIVFEPYDRINDFKELTESDVRIIEISGRVEPRVGISAYKYKEACINLSNKILDSVKNNSLNGKSVLVMGTEEFMYPAIFTAAQIEKKFDNVSVKTHSTTRSPIVPFEKDDYIIKKRNEISSFYEYARKTFIYNLEKYDNVIIITDSVNYNKNALKDLSSSLRHYGSTNITFVRWVE